MASIKIGRRSENFCAFGQIGDCKKEAKNETSLDLSSTTETVSNFISSKTMNLASSGVNLNDLKLTLGDISGNCAIDASQKITSTQTTSGELSPELSQDLFNQIKSSIDAAIDAQAKMKSEAGGDQALAENIQKFKNDIHTRLEANMNDTQIMNISNSVYNKNDKEFKVGNCSGNAKLDFSQDIVSQLVTQGIMKGVTAQVAAAEAEASANVKAKLVSEGDSGGFAGIFKSLFDGINTAFTGPLATVYIAMAVLCCLCCLGLVIFLLSPGGQHATVVAANTGAKAAVL